MNLINAQLHNNNKVLSFFLKPDKYVKEHAVAKIKVTLYRDVYALKIRPHPQFFIYKMV